MVVFVINYPILAGSNTLYFIVRLDTVEVADTFDTSRCKLRRVTYFERDLFLIGKFAPRVFGDKVETVHVNRLAVLSFGIVTVGNEYDIALDVFLDDKPGAAA